ncbi:hypothetical protein LEMLEM_LOCUS5109, partial [Lemmus lemmus]
TAEGKYDTQRPWRTLRRGSRCQPSIRDTRQFHTTNIGQEQRDQLCQDVTSTYLVFSGSLQRRHPQISRKKS